MCKKVQAAATFDDSVTLVIRKKEDRVLTGRCCTARSKSLTCAFYLFIRRAHPRKCLEAK